MVQNICEIYSWMDVKDAALSPDEINILGNIELLQDEVKTLFDEVIQNQIFEGEDIFSYYLVPPNFWEKFLNNLEKENYEDSFKCVTELYFSKLDETYKKLNEYLNLTFYSGYIESYTEGYNYFSSFYNIFFGDGARRFYEYTLKKGIIDAYDNLNYQKIKNIVIFYLDALINSYENIIEELEKVYKRLTDNRIKNNLLTPKTAGKKALRRVTENKIKYGENIDETLADIQQRIETLKNSKRYYEDWYQSFQLSPAPQIARLFRPYFNISI